MAELIAAGERRVHPHSEQMDYAHDQIAKQPEGLSLAHSLRGKKDLVRHEKPIRPVGSAIEVSEVLPCYDLVLWTWFAWTRAPSATATQELVEVDALT